MTPRPTTLRMVIPRLSATDSMRGRARERRQQHEHNDGEHVLHDEPADRDMTRAGVKLAAVREHANQDDGARDGER